MIGRSALGLVLAAFALMVAMPTASAQEGEAPSLPDSFSEPMPLYSAALGSFTRPISSSPRGTLGLPRLTGCVAGPIQQPLRCCSCSPGSEP